jgi:transcriptional regulator with XRE-family HTH domain
MTAFSKNLKYLRKQTKLTQQAIARQTGLTRTTWANYETGNSVPDFEILLTLCLFFDVTADGLLDADLETTGVEMHRRKKTEIDKVHSLIFSMQQKVSSINADMEQVSEILSQAATNEQSQALQTEELYT